MDEATAVKAIHRIQRIGLLAERREKLGLSQSQVARGLRVSQAAVSRWEAAKSRPRAEHALALVELLEITA
jgi:transcriptional regulator with XRE-family HTH domain